MCCLTWNWPPQVGSADAKFTFMFYANNMSSLFVTDYNYLQSFIYSLLHALVSDE